MLSEEYFVGVGSWNSSLARFYCILFTVGGKEVCTARNYVFHHFMCAELQQNKPDKDLGFFSLYLSNFKCEPILFLVGEFWLFFDLDT